MEWKEESLREFGRNIQKLIEKNDLTRQESYEMFSQLLLNNQPDIQQGAFLAALAGKGEVPQEIVGAWQAIAELDTTPINEDFDGPLVENSGTGMDQLKTFNVSSAAAIVAAAGGARIGRHGSRALTSSCGAIDILEEIGIDVECEVEVVKKSIQQTGIGVFNGMSANVHPNSLFRILGQIRFGSTLNIAASLASPCKPTHALRGVYVENMIPKVSKVMQEIGYYRAMIVHGYDSDGKKGMDELSTLGETVVHEFFPDGAENKYSIRPEDVGIETADYSSIAALGNIRKEAIRFLKVISGTGHQECIDFTCYNAGAILYLIGKVDDIKSGVEECREIIHSGMAFNKLSEWVSVQVDSMKKGIERFMKIAAAAELKM